MGENVSKPPRRWYRKKRYLIPLILLGILLFLHLPNTPVKIQLGPDTTIIDGPLNADGTVSYVAYLNQEYSRGVTPDNNAAPLLLKAMGPEFLPEAVRAETLRRLGLDDWWIKVGPHLAWWRKFSSVPATRPANRGKEDSQQEREDQDEHEADLSEVIKQLDKGQVHPRLETWLAVNARPLELIAQGAAKPRYYLPVLSQSNPPQLLDCVTSGTSAFFELSRALAARSRLRGLQGDLAGAWTDVLTIHRVARLVAQQPFLIPQLTAIIIERMAAEAGTYLVTRCTVAIDQAHSALKELQALPPVSDVVASIDRGERFFICDATMMLSRGANLAELEGNGQSQDAPFWTKHLLNLDWNEILRICNRHYDVMIKPLKLARTDLARDQARDEFSKLVEKLENAPSRIGRIVLYRATGWPTRTTLSREIANVLLAILLPSMGRAVDLQDEARMSLEVEKTALALACHKARHGRWPARLDELAGDLLKQVPTDLFSGQPLVYRPEGDGYVLYSVGINARDDGGEKDRPDSQEQADDIAVRIPPPTEKDIPKLRRATTQTKGS